MRNDEGDSAAGVKSDFNSSTQGLEEGAKHGSHRSGCKVELLRSF